MVPARALYAITTWVWDDDYEKEGLQEPEIYDDKAAANTAARHLMRRLADRLNPFGDRDEYNFEDNLDDEGLYRGALVVVTDRTTLISALDSWTWALFATC